MTTYKYKVFKMENAVAYCLPTEMDAYFAEELGGQNKSDWDAALAQGYRWIRTDGGHAILELEVKTSE